MNKLFLILIIPFISKAQTNSEIILNFVNQNMGKKVGSGKCFALVDHAYMQINKDWKNQPNNKSRYYSCGKRIKPKNIQPGDVVEYTNVVDDGVKRPDHIGIIYSIKGDTVMVAQQNCHGNLKESRVVLKQLEEPDIYHKITIKFYRY